MEEREKSPRVKPQKRQLSLMDAFSRGSAKRRDIQKDSEQGQADSSPLVSSISSLVHGAEAEDLALRDDAIANIAIANVAVKETEDLPLRDDAIANVAITNVAITNVAVQETEDLALHDDDTIANIAIANVAVQDPHPDASTAVLNSGASEPAPISDATLPSTEMITKSSSASTPSKIDPTNISPPDLTNTSKSDPSTSTALKPSTSSLQLAKPNPSTSKLLMSNSSTLSKPDLSTLKPSKNDPSTSEASQKRKAGSKIVTRKYQAEWEEEFRWAEPSKTIKNYAFCKVCGKDIPPRKSSLHQHQKQKDHQNRFGAQAISNRKLIEKIATKLKDDEVKKAELHLAITCCCHSSMRTMDHLSDVIVSNAGEASTLSKIRLHRTKCTHLITKVVAPYMKKQLISDMKEAKFSLLLDESTDVTTQKHLCICVRYYSSKEEKIMTRLLALVPVVSTTGEELFNSLQSTLKECGLDLKDCIGFSSDGASNMVGKNNSVFSRVKAASPHCIQLKCICHSLALCVQKAFNKLPDGVGFLLVEIPKWFKKSTIRREDYKMLFSVMNAQGEREGTPMPFEKFSSTRWLVRGKVMFNILTNYEELQCYFRCASLSADANTRYKVKAILNILEDKAAYLAILFATPVVAEFEKLNAMFQATEADPEKLLQDLCQHRASLWRRIYDSRGNARPTSQVEFGPKFTAEFHKCRSRSSETEKPKLDQLELCCQEFLRELLKEVDQRLPDNRNILRGLRNLHPGKILSQCQPPFQDLPMLNLCAANWIKVENQYRRINSVIWKEEPVFDGTVPIDPVKFWIGVSKHTNSVGERHFTELSEFALACLSMPVSNADVERVFSTLTFIKSKLRNNIGSELLESILRIKSTFASGGMCCKDYVVSKDLIATWDNTDIYDADNSDNFNNVTDILM